MNDTTSQDDSETLSSMSKTRCGPRRMDARSIVWQVWAPFAEKVELVIDDGEKVRHVGMEPTEHGYYRTAVTGGACHRYAFRLNESQEYPDPCSMWQRDGVHGRSAIYFPETFSWTDHAWRGIARHDLVFYEVHVGTFTRAGTFEATIERLPALRDLGITALEIMPVSQFPGDRNWGYDGVYLYAAQDSYGGPRGLQTLVDAAHRHGLAVFLDVVYNHLGPEGNYLNAFGPYFTDRYKTPWGAAINYDGAGSDPVRDYVLNNARMWLEEFHLDGLRLDAVHAIFDLSAQHILADIKRVAVDVAKRQNREIAIIAESDLNDPRLLHSPEKGGYGLDAQWSDDFHHTVHAQLTGESQGYYVDFGQAEQLAQVLNDPFLYSGQFSAHRGRRHGAPARHLPGDQFIVAIQNHDQVGNRAQGDRLSALISLPQQRLAASLMLLAPHLPFLFMGEEYGETRPFPFFCSFGDPELIEAVRKGRREEFAAFAWEGEVPDPQSPETFKAAKLTWSWPEESAAAAIRQLYRDLLQARRTWPVMRNFVDRQCELLTANGQSVLRLRRGKSESTEQIEVFFNVQGAAAAIPPQGRPGRQMLFSSESPKYHGARTKSSGSVELLPYECLVYGSVSWNPLS